MKAPPGTAVARPALMSQCQGPSAHSHTGQSGILPFLPGKRVTPTSPAVPEENYFSRAQVAPAVKGGRDEEVGGLGESQVLGLSLDSPHPHQALGQ